MTTEPREPSRLPVRGTAATVGTIGALTLLLSFQGGPLAPSDPAIAANGAPAMDQLIAADGTTGTGTDTATMATEPVTYVGEAYRTRWGDVQVEVTLHGSDITEVLALQLPASDRHTIELSEYAEPILRQEALATDSAVGLSVISGATYTSEAYADSLQSAIDQAGRATAAASVADVPPVVEPGAVVEYDEDHEHDEDDEYHEDDGHHEHDPSDEYDEDDEHDEDDDHAHA